MTRSKIDFVSVAFTGVIVAFAVVTIWCQLDETTRRRRADGLAMSIYAQERYQAGYLRALRDTGAAPAPMGGAE